LEELRGILASTTIALIASAPLLHSEPRRDTIRWCATPNGCFSCTYAFKLLQPPVTITSCEKTLFKGIWGVRVPEKAKIFLWLSARLKILTNKERHRRHMSNSPNCTLCATDEESILHLLRDCPRIKIGLSKTL
ncbi:hypothetical protein V2J09_018326, partial [Rumex salicifolius]